MFRQAPLLLARAFAGVRRSLSTAVPATSPTDAAFIEAWKKVNPTLDPPKTPLAFLRPRPPIPSSIPSKLTVNFASPYELKLSSKEVDQVILPATTGLMGILPGHVASIVELKPGVLSVLDGIEVAKYFISGGFAFVHANSYTDIVAVEVFPLEHFDQNAAQKGLAEFTHKLSTASTDLEKAEAQIDVDVYSSLNAALTA